jgi:CheY-like chemotaxis protein
MRLDFNILWVEDQPNQVNSQRESIERKMRSEGFKLQTVFTSSVEDAAVHLGDNIFRDHVDLVLMDFELAGKTNGGEGLEVVREWCPFKDIVFYSAKRPTELKSIIAEKEISGVFCTARIGLPDTVLGIFGVLVKKVLDIDHSRGIVMGATSEIDDFVNRSLEIYLGLM